MFGVGFEICEKKKGKKKQKEKKNEVEKGKSTTKRTDGRVRCSHRKLAAKQSPLDNAGYVNAAPGSVACGGHGCQGHATRQ